MESLDPFWMALTELGQGAHQRWTNTTPLSKTSLMVMPRVLSLDSVSAIADTLPAMPVAHKQSHL
jgi:hypothetical protein